MRIIDQLRRHPKLGGKWRYDRDAHEYIRDDGVKVYARSILRRCCIDPCGCWFVEKDGALTKVFDIRRWGQQQ